MIMMKLVCSIPPLLQTKTQPQVSSADRIQGFGTCIPEPAAMAYLVIRNMVPALQKTDLKTVV